MMKINLHTTATRTMGRLRLPMVLLLAGCGGGGIPVDHAPEPEPVVTASERSVHRLSTPAPIDPGTSPAYSSSQDAALWEGELEVRVETLERLLQLEDDTDPELLQLLMTDPDPDLRETVVDLLTETGGLQAPALLREALLDPHPAVRQAAQEGLEDLGYLDE